MTSFWQKILKPILVQAPMEGVTDVIFREMLGLCSRPAVFFTEFVNVEGLNSEGRERLLPKLKFTSRQRPIVAQIWGNNPDNFTKTAKMLVKMDFDGIDLNMGCPDKAVIKMGCGGALISNHRLASEIFLAAKKGACSLPVSIKTRIGFDKIETEKWIGFLLEQNPDVIIIHGKTVTGKDKKKTDWEEIGKAVRLRNKLKSQTFIIGNGDITSLYQAKELAEKYGLDGIMIGRAMISNFWIFNEKLEPEKIPQRDKLKLLIKHLELAKKYYGNHASFNPLKKYFRNYISGYEGANELRVNLMKQPSIEEAIKKLLSVIASETQ
ncbi:tRNA-dihydrouridine synthase [Candidatus Microgenomates bacterium]|nr:tRNA-dihydrouridine synthase [Candidatus Microgenomates bacterium]